MRESWEDMHYGNEDFEALDSSQGSEYLVYHRGSPPRDDTNKWLKWRKDSTNSSLRQRSSPPELWIISLRFAEKIGRRVDKSVKVWYYQESSGVLMFSSLRSLILGFFGPISENGIFHIQTDGGRVSPANIVQVRFNVATSVPGVTDDHLRDAFRSIPVPRCDTCSVLSHGPTGVTGHVTFDIDKQFADAIRPALETALNRCGGRIIDHSPF